MTNRTLLPYTGCLVALATALLLVGCPGDETSTDTSTGDIGTDTTTDVVTGDGGGCPPGWICTSDVPAQPDVTTPDGATTDATTPGGFGAPCLVNTDCDSGWCIEEPEGLRCTVECPLDGCPAGYGCKTLDLPDPVSVCARDVLDFCGPCQGDDTCFGGVCLDNGVDDPYCTAQCSTANPCPDGFDCLTTTDVNNNERSLCIPASGSCGCSAISVGAVRACSVTVDGIGTCQGFETCDGTAWGSCNAPTPTAELCDYQDNDCDGDVDEDFVNADGNYDQFDNCGVCGENCGSAIAFATAECNASEYDPPQCTVVECEAPYFKVNDFGCGSFPLDLCAACVNDIDCGVEGALCQQMSDNNTYCTAPCETVDDCPAGYECADTNNVGSTQCMPVSGACACDSSAVGLQRACEETYTEAGKPDVTCAGVQVCQSGNDWGTCQLGEDVCDNEDNDCDGVIDQDWVNGDGIYDKVENCGTCGNDCTANPAPDSIPICDTTGPVPFCNIECPTDKVDVNNNPVDGCECTIDGVPDVPDGVDHNCDGVDGDIATSLFVAKNGDDSGSGAIDAPLATIQAGIDKAVADGIAFVLVATGVYSESVTLAAGVGVYGGYSGDYRDRDTTLYQTAIFGQAPTAEQPGTVNAFGLDDTSAEGTALAGFTVFGVVNKQAGGSSYAIYAEDCGDQLTLADNTVVAGSGGNGGAGTDGTDGDGGVAGGDGVIALDIGAETCGAGDHRAGGDGGSFTCGSEDVSGGAGGTAICPDYSEVDNAGACPLTSSADPQTSDAAAVGTAGSGPSGGAGGTAGFDSYRIATPLTACSDAPSATVCEDCLLPQSGLGSKAGGTGQAGAAGLLGAAGTGCASSAGSVVDGLWVSAPGVAGGDGGNGGGGGGGGAGGGVEQTGCLTFGNTGGIDLGGSGGGGGSGGCGGTGGTGGTGGGGSFGIFLTFTAAPASVPAIDSNIIVRGPGGIGGAGGPGGTGGGGASGGAGGPEDQGDVLAIGCAPAGGGGGDGGDGGAGGGGGGGCGGASFGIYIDNGTGANAWKSGNVFQADGAGGAGGVGGVSLGTPGEAGQAGAEGDTNF